MNNQPPSRQDLLNTNYQPVDPAFRPPGPADGPVTYPPIETNAAAGNNPPVNPYQQAPLQAQTAGQPTPAQEQIPPNQMPQQAPAQPAADPIPPANQTFPPGDTPGATKNPPPRTDDFPEFDDPLDDDSETKRVITIGGVIIAFLFITSGILYFVTRSRNSNDQTAVAPPVENGQVEPSDNDDAADNDDQPAVEQPELPEDTPTLKHILVKEEENPLWQAENYFAAINQAGQPVELIFYDQDGDKLSLENFSRQSEILIPDYLFDILKPNYYFLVIPDPDSENPKAGFIFASIFSNYQKSEEILERWESYIAQDLKSFILLGNDYDFVAGFERPVFSSSQSHPGGRFFNFLKDGSVSINYLVMRDKIVITNSFNSFENLINYVMTRSDM
ncbi:MAG: hypothetical protein ABIC19_00250 [Patescibacteria group bacterium]